jgi:hypothetical protein
MMLDDWGVKSRQIVRDGRNVKEKVHTIEYLTSATNDYLESNDTEPDSRGPQVPVKENIETCASILVNYRRARDQRNSSSGTAE